MKLKQIVFSGKNKVEVVTVNKRLSLAPDQVLIKTVCSLISPGTEIAALTGTHSKSNLQNKPAWLDYPSVPGYLVCGRIAGKGRTVANYRIGDRVVAEGPGVWNSHQSHLVMDASDWKIIPIAENVSFEEAVFTKMGSISMTGPRVIHPRLGDTVAVMGLGIVGQIASQLAVLSGAGEVVGVDPIERRRKIASRFPGISAVAPDSASLNRIIPGNRLSGFDHVIEASGHPSAFLKALEIARIRGKIAVLSSPHRPFEIRLYDHIHSKGLQVLGAHGFVLPFTEEINDAWSDARQRRFFMDLLSRKKVNVRPLISHQVKVSEAPRIYQALIAHPERFLGVVFHWN